MRIEVEGVSSIIHSVLKEHKRRHVVEIIIIINNKINDNKINDDADENNSRRPRTIMGELSVISDHIQPPPDTNEEQSDGSPPNQTHCCTEMLRPGGQSRGGAPCGIGKTVAVGGL